MATQDPNALLTRLLREPAESPWLEFKENNSDLEEIGRCVSALANAAILAERDRAFIVWGVENQTKRRVGSSVCLKELRRGGENFSNWVSRLVEPRLMMEFLDFEVRGKTFAILVIEPTYDRPVRFSGSEYIRIGENVRKLAEFPDHERALWLATGRRKFESAVALPHQTPEQVLESLNIETYYRLSGKTQPKNPDEIIRQFAASSFIVSDMEGRYDIANLGALLLANDMTNFPSIAHKSVRVIQYDGMTKQRSVDEVEGKRGYAVGFQGMMKFIMDRLPKEERYLDGVRKTVSAFSATAIRDIIANALIHQDFTIGGAGPMIELYRDRVEIINPGNTLIEVDRIIDERRSRNEKLAAAMRNLGICEERGGGIDKAIIEIEQMSLPAPEFYRSENSMKVVLYGPKKFNQLSKGDKLWACYCHCVVRWLQRDYMSNTSLRERFSLPDEDYQAVSAVISAARQAGRIDEAEPGQGKRNARYVPYWAV